MNKLLYETEFDQWLAQTINHLKTRQLDQLDYPNLIEELEALGRSEKAAVKSLVLQILIHFLLLAYWESERQRNGRRWAGEITVLRAQLLDRLTTNYQKELQVNLPSLYGKAQLAFKRKTGLDTPKSCPDDLGQILDELWLPIDLGD
jgi:hypothetical protein